MDEHPTFWVVDADNLPHVFGKFCQHKELHIKGGFDFNQSSLCKKLPKTKHYWSRYTHFIDKIHFYIAIYNIIMYFILFSYTIIRLPYNI